MRRLLTFAILILLLLLSACGSTSHALTASHAWVRFTPENGAAYVTIANTTPNADTLVSVAVPSTIAEAAEIHQTSTSSGGMMGMNMISSIDLPASYTLTMKPGGYHIMLTGIHTAPAVGSSVPITLTFAHHTPLLVNAEVRA